MAAVLLVVAGGAAGPPAEDPARARERMVRDQIEARGVTDARTLAALRKVERHRFVPPEAAALAYADHPLDIGDGQTISQPYIVAAMTELARPSPKARALEIGTGCGYQTAVLAECFHEVWSVELEPELAARAAAALSELGYLNIRVRCGDGALGWPEEAPFDAIVVTAAPERIPPALPAQLADGGRLVIPLGAMSQELWVVTRSGGGFERRAVMSVRFVPLR